MGGKGGALSSWLREFMSLVFTQTLQAFIYAIIISFIMYGMTDLSADVSTDDQNASIGLMSVFALTSVFKIEDLSKKIFGISDNAAGHKGAMKSLAKTAFAIGIGKRALDNVGKIGSGISSFAKTGSESRKARLRAKEDLDDLKKPTVGAVGGGSATVGEPGSATGGDSDSSGAAGMSAAASTGKGTSQEEYNKKVRNVLRTYEDKQAELKKARMEGIKSIATGLAESIAVIPGAIAGGVIGGADGDIDEMLRGIAAGAGVGDAIGAGAVNLVTKTHGTVKTATMGAIDTRRDRKIIKEIEQYRDDLERAVRASTNNKVEDSQ